MRLVQRRGCLSLGSFPGNEASFSYLYSGLKSVAAKAATAAAVPTPLSSNGNNNWDCIKSVDNNLCT